MAGLSLEKKSLGDNTVQELLQMADEFDAMAAVASIPDATQALGRLAARFRVFASGWAASQLDGGLAAPGKPAPRNGIYELRNAFGTQSGDAVRG